MITKYFEIEKAHLTIVALDAVYEVKFAHETIVGYTWEFDRNSDAVNQKTSERTGNIQVLFVPSENTMSFPEDAKRPRTYVMPVEKARMLYQTLTRFPNYWFALDMANLATK